MQLPPSAIATAARRWLDLLRTSDISQTWALIRNNPKLGDLTITQYAAALDWLTEIGLLEPHDGRRSLGEQAQRLSAKDLSGLAFARALESARPPWLLDADGITTEYEVPLDAAELAEELGLSDAETLRGIRQAHGKVDSRLREEVGLAGELALVDLLRTQWPGAVSHVAAEDDGLGYDLALSLEGSSWHLEVKSTSRRGRLVVHLSRNEYETCITDETWQLVAVGLAEDHTISCIAVANREYIARAAPVDVSAASWETARFNLGPSELSPGLSFVPSELLQRADPVLRRGAPVEGTPFAWLPHPNRRRRVGCGK